MNVVWFWLVVPSEKIFPNILRKHFKVCQVPLSTCMLHVFWHSTVSLSNTQHWRIFFQRCLLHTEVDPRCSMFSFFIFIIHVQNQSVRPMLTELSPYSPLRTESPTNHTPSLLPPLTPWTQQLQPAQTNFNDGVELEGDFFSYCDNLIDERDDLCY